MELIQKKYDDINFNYYSKNVDGSLRGLVTNTDNKENNKYVFDEESDKILMNLDIDWCGAEVKNLNDDNQLIYSSGELLTWFNQMISKERFFNLLIEYLQTHTLLKTITQNKLYLDLKGTYFWYFGNEPITSSSTPGSGTVYGMNESIELGWHVIDDNPTQIQVGPKRLDTKSTWYIAIPAYLGFNKAYGGELADELMVPQNITLADGKEYTVFTAMAQSKSINYIIK